MKKCWKLGVCKKGARKRAERSIGDAAIWTVPASPTLSMATHSGWLDRQLIQLYNHRWCTCLPLLSNFMSSFTEMCFKKRRFTALTDRLHDWYFSKQKYFWVILVLISQFSGGQNLTWVWNVLQPTDKWEMFLTLWKLLPVNYFRACRWNQFKPK